MVVFGLRQKPCCSYCVYDSGANSDTSGENTRRDERLKKSNSVLIKDVNWSAMQSILSAIQVRSVPQVSAIKATLIHK